MIQPVTRPGSLILRGGRIVDPARGIDQVDDLFVRDGVICIEPARGAAEFDASGLIVAPGLFDMHVHLREPGQDAKETIETGCRAAVAGGFTAVACMPNTSPAIDNVETIQFVKRRAEAAGLCRVYPVAAITEGRAGQRVVDFASLREAGAAAFSDDGDGVEDDAVMAQAFEQARQSDSVIIQHCEFKGMSAGGAMHAGPTAEALGVGGIDPAAEEAMIERDLDLVARIGARYHVAHISTARAVELVRQAKGTGLPVTTEVCPHHLLLTDRDCAGGDPNFKMHPPLRTKSDVEACLAGLVDGTIDCLVTDHAPHTAGQKAAGFAKAPFGIVGLETALGLTATELVHKGGMGWAAFLQLLCCNPFNVLNLGPPQLEAGCAAEICLIDPNRTWTVDPGQFESKSKNTPFAGWELSVRTVGTIRMGCFTYLDEGESRRMARTLR